MKRYAVGVTSSAGEQIASIRAWWMGNRPASPDLFDRELEQAIEQLGHAPFVSAVYRTTEGVDVRRVVLAHSRYAVYFVAGPGVVDIVAVWHTARGEGPPLL